MKPTVGRIVHYVSHGTPPREDGSQAFPSACRTALVTEVGAWVSYSASKDERVDEDGHRYRDTTARWYDDACYLDVRTPTGGFFNLCLYDAGGTSDTPGAPTALSYQGGTWHWPERSE